MNLDTNTILIVAGVVVALIVLLLLLRPRKQRPTIERRADGEGPYVASTDRPYMRAPDPAPPPQPLQRGADGPQGNGIPDEIATATTDLAGQVLGVGARAELAGADELTVLKGVGPKLAARLNELGFTRYEQLAGLCDTEVSMLEEKLGPFRGRLTRDRVVEQARFLARGDRDGFEAQFGSLGGGAGGTSGASEGGGMPTIRG